MNCHCGSKLAFEECCEPYLKGEKVPVSPEALMRSRYSAYCVGNADYLVNTTHPTTRRFHRKADMLEWSQQNKWARLEIVSAKGNYVTFKAFYYDVQGTAHTHYERSRFQQYNNKWYYLDGSFKE